MRFAPTPPEPRCTARWVYRGSTRAKCYDRAGHDGRHWNGTVRWSDTTPGAEPHQDSRIRWDDTR